MLAAGFAILIVADLTPAFASGLTGVAAGVALWGLQMGVTKGALAALVADAAPPDARGSAYGIFNFASGLALLVASVLFGVLWDRRGLAAAFFASVLFAAAAIASLLLLRQGLIWTRRKTVNRSPLRRSRVRLNPLLAALQVEEACSAGSRAHGERPVCALLASAASSSHGRNPSRGHRRKQAIGFEPNQRLAGSSHGTAFWHCWHERRCANVCQSAKKFLVQHGYTLRNVVCSNRRKVDRDPPALLLTTVGGG